jgi:hypothetical protein
MGNMPVDDSVSMGKLITPRVASPTTTPHLTAGLSLQHVYQPLKSDWIPEKSANEDT